MDFDKQAAMGIGRGRGRGRFLIRPPSPEFQRTVPCPIPASFGRGGGRGLPPPIKSQMTSAQPTENDTSKFQLRTPEQLHADQLKLQDEDQKRWKLFEKMMNRRNSTKTAEMPILPRCPRGFFDDDY